MSNPALTPSIYSGILFWSRVTPNAIAVGIGSHKVSYKGFCVDIEKVTRRLHRLNLERGSRVACHIHNPYLRWLSVIALARLGLVSALVSQGGREIDHLLVKAILSDRASALGGRDVIEVVPQWLDSEADAWPAVADTGHEADAPWHLVVSSGTTGKPKKAVLSCGDILARIQTGARTYGLNGASRVMTTMGPGTVGGVTMPVFCWWSGGTVLLPSLSEGETLAGLLKAEPNLLFMSTAQLGTLVDSLPADARPVENLRVFVGGSALPPVLSRKTRERLSPLLFIIYGSTETGGVTLGHASAADSQPAFTGYVLPTVQVEVVDADEKPLHAGAAGEIRIRSNSMIDGYAEDPESTKEAFRDGWFYPGDTGVLDPQGGLSIVGRSSELMNFGGVKMAPERLERALTGCPGVADLAIFSLRHQDGERPWAAVVAHEGFAEADLHKQFRKSFPDLPPMSIARVDKLPRNDMGKVLRGQLAASVQQAVASAGTAPAGGYQNGAA